jgi:hypothetical protein
MSCRAHVARWLQVAGPERNVCTRVSPEPLQGIGPGIPVEHRVSVNIPIEGRRGCGGTPVRGATRNRHQVPWPVGRLTLPDVHQVLAIRSRHKVRAS